jgi:predicted nucleic acid-binding protein
MKDILFDTNMATHLQEYMESSKGSLFEFIKKYPELQNSKFLISAITLGEIEYGINIQDDHDEKIRLTKILDFLKSLHIFYIDDQSIISNYAKIRSDLFMRYAPKEKRKRRNKLSEWKDPTSEEQIQTQENDIWICSVAITYNLVLITNDKMNAIKSVVGDNLDIIHIE